MFRGRCRSGCAQVVPGAVDRGRIGRFKARRRRECARISVLRGKPGAIPVRLDNLYSTPLRGTMEVDLPAGWTGQAQVSFALEPGETKIVSVPLGVPETAPIASSPQRLTVTFDREGLPPAIKPLSIAVIAPESVGNLLKNGDFEQFAPTEKHPRTGAGRMRGWSRAPGWVRGWASMCSSFPRPASGRIRARKSSSQAG